MPLPGVKAHPEAIRQQALAAIVAGQSQKSVADKLGIHPVTISGWWQKFKRSQPADIVAVPSVERHKQDLIFPAFSSIRKALECTKNVYQSANIAVQVLKGIGIFAPDAPNLSLHFAQPPTSWSNAAPQLQAPPQAIALPAAAPTSPADPT